MRISDWSSDVCSSDLVDSTFPYYSKVDEKDHLPEIVMQQIEHFFTHYKDLEAQKWVRIGTCRNAAEARQIIIEAIDRAKQAKAAAVRSVLRRCTPESLRCPFYLFIIATALVYISPDTSMPP